LFCHTIAAQENFVTAGGEILLSESSITFSIGQVFYQETQTSNKLEKLNVGVQQPYASYVFTDPFKVKLEILAYPNPTIDNLNLVIKDYKLQELTYTLFTINSKLIQTGKITQEQTVINMGNLPSGIYLLHVIGWVNQGNFKIIKN
jgi:hypothetical protein